MIGTGEGSSGSSSGGGGGGAGDDYEVSKIGVSNDWSTDSRGYVRSTGDLLLEEATVASHMPSRVFTPTYPHTVEPATRSLAASISADAGPRRATAADRSRHAGSRGSRETRLRPAGLQTRAVRQ